MKRITDFPNISKEMKALYRKFMRSGNFEEIMPHIDKFLNKYPYYTEALIFKARALMALGRNNDALKCIKIAKRINKLQLIGRFDEAEIYLEKRKNADSIKAYVDAVKAYAIELKDGMDSYYLCCNSESKKKIRSLTQKALADFFAHDEKNKPFDKLQKSFMKMKNRFHDY